MSTDQLGADDLGGGPGAPAGTDVGLVVAERLAGLTDRPLSEHVPVLDGVHHLLQDTLATLDEV